MTYCFDSIPFYTPCFKMFWQNDNFALYQRTFCDFSVIALSKIDQPKNHVHKLFMVYMFFEKSRLYQKRSYSRICFYFWGQMFLLNDLTFTFSGLTPNWITRFFMYFIYSSIFKIGFSSLKDTREVEKLSFYSSITNNFVLYYFNFNEDFVSIFDL